MWRHNKEKDVEEKDWGNDDKKPQPPDSVTGMDWDFILSSDSDGSSRDLFRGLTHSQGIVGTSTASLRCSLSRRNTHRYTKQKSEKKKKQEEQGQAEEKTYQDVAFLS